jgi:hypothetical protein
MCGEIGVKGSSNGTRPYRRARTRTAGAKAQLGIFCGDPRRASRVADCPVDTLVLKPVVSVELPQRTGRARPEGICLTAPGLAHRVAN